MSEQSKSIEQPRYVSKIQKIIDMEGSTRLGRARLAKLRRWAEINLPEARLKELDNANPRFAETK